MFCAFSGVFCFVVGDPSRVTVGVRGAGTIVMEGVLEGPSRRVSDRAQGSGAVGVVGVCFVLGDPSRVAVGVRGAGTINVDGVVEGPSRGVSDRARGSGAVRVVGVGRNALGDAGRISGSVAVGAEFAGVKTYTGSGAGPLPIRSLPLIPVHGVFDEGGGEGRDGPGVGATKVVKMSCRGGAGKPRDGGT